MSFTPSPRQQAIFDHVVQPASSSLIVEAVAGSGKTTTLVELLKLLPADPDSILPPAVLFLAFNKLIAETLAARCPKNVLCKTFHSLGLAALSASLPKRPQIEARKVPKIVFEMTEKDNPDVAAIIKLVSLAKGSLLLPDSSDSLWEDIIRHYDVQLEEPRQSLRIAKRALEKSNNDLLQIDFDDMLYLAVLRRAPFQRYDYIMVDEAQDTNDIQIEMLRLMTTAKTKFVFVGDPHQAIYGFRGANADAMDRIKSAFSCTTLPLDISYRCAKAVVRKAQEYVRHIQPSNSAPEGQCQTLSKYHEGHFQPGSAILCRNTAPVVGFAYQLLKRNIRCLIRGRDIGAQLCGVIKKMRADSIDCLIDRLGEWRAREVQRAANDQNESAIERIHDQHECLTFFIEQLPEDRRTVDTLLNRIVALFTDDENKGVVTLSTVHKAKGLEWDEVFILDGPKLMPSKFAKLPWQQAQERNLIYVAITRAKQSLYYINSNTWQEVEPEVEINPIEERRAEVGDDGLVM